VPRRSITDFLLSFPNSSKESLSRSGKFPLIICFPEQDIIKINDIIKSMLLNFIKKKTLNNLYNKIIQQSKETSILADFDSDISLNIEFLQINLSLILWYMNSKKIKKKYLDFLISRFIDDLESASIELGFAESGLKKKVRKLAQNFYQNLDYNLKIINELLKSNGEISLTKIFNERYEKKNTNFKKLENYYKNNIKLFLNLDKKSFWNLNFNFVSK
jgi:hypothetical protein